MNKTLFIISACLLTSLLCQAEGWIRINQLGYLPQSIKVAVFIADESCQQINFQLRTALGDDVVYTGAIERCNGVSWGMTSAARLNFSTFELPGSYYIQLGDFKSQVFRIDTDVYAGIANYLLNYMRQQRCGYNPYLKDSCHLHDGFIVDHPTRSGEIINVTGGWHDASDYLQYLPTSANAVYQMLFAYQQNPDVFADEYLANGNKGENGVPDILDEARWGLEWMLKMNPDSGVMFNQIADDRDHKGGYRLPNKDQQSYDNSNYRPVYFITGERQGLGTYKNRTTGVSSSAGKFASSFAIGSRLFKNVDVDFSRLLSAKALNAYEFALTDVGETQTACIASPYFYEESNYVDDLELAAFEMYSLTKDLNYIKEASYWGEVEPITPWMERGFARHYQYYPFVNLGHYYLADLEHNKQPLFQDNMKKGLEMIYERAQADPFLNGIPFIWCSNNLVAAAITQARLYNQVSGDDSFIEMEVALFDWLLGCNPWGTSMICGLPDIGDSPLWPHSAIPYLLKETTYGGLVDGPVYRSIFENLRGVKLSKYDEYAPFQFGKAVYHDDMADYSSNEPTMDGTASLSFYFSHMEKKGRMQKHDEENVVIDRHGAIRRIAPDQKVVYLIFSADEHGEGAAHILDVLEHKQVKASFFLTGNFLRNTMNKKSIKRMIEDGHYLGAHSDRHLLYNTWEKRDSLLVDYNMFSTDLKANYSALKNAGVNVNQATYFLPPYEWYNDSIVGWSRHLGLKVINYTPGIGTQADYTTPDMINYKSSQELYDKVIRFEDETGLDGAIILIHLGTENKRKDKFYHKLESLVDMLTANGYALKRLNN